MKETHRIATIFAGVFTLIQSILWCIIAIYSVAVYACQAEYPFQLNLYKITISDLLYMSYYYGKCRVQPGHPEIEAPSAARTYYWMLVYGVISAIWIPTSVLLLVASINKIYGKYGACLFLPWIINTAIIIIVDVCATVVYAIDISHTLTLKDYAEFIKPLEIILKGADGITVVPAVEMTVYFSRAIVFWLLNFILLGVTIQASRALKRMSPTSAFVESEARVKASGDSTPSQWVNIKSNDMSLKRLPRLQIEDSPVRTRSPFDPISPQSPISNTPPQHLREIDPAGSTPPINIAREPSLRRGNSSPVYDVNGRHLGNIFPEEIHKHIPTNDAALKSGLSNQVPWTYAPPGELNLRIKQAALHNKDPAKPHIPQPDYTMHNPPARRPAMDFTNLSRSNSNLVPNSDSPYQEEREKYFPSWTT